MATSTERGDGIGWDGKGREGILFVSIIIKEHLDCEFMNFLLTVLI